MAQIPNHSSKTGAMAPLACIIAGLSMAATPAYALDASSDGPDQPEFPLGQGIFPADLDATGFDPEAETTAHHRRRYRHRHHHYYHDDGIDGGDILAGALIIGGIAAIASAASNDNRREQERAEQRRRYEQANATSATNARTSGGSGIDSAVRQCRSQIERDVRVGTVDTANRLASGWVVSGTLFNGSGFSCQIDNNGQISSIDYSGLAGAGQSKADGQWSDQSYAAARASLPPQSPDQQTGSARGVDVAYNDTYGVIDDGARPLVDIDGDQPMPAYPGGPLPGEERRE